MLRTASTLKNLNRFNPLRTLSTNNAPPFHYQPLFDLGESDTEYRLISKDYVSKVNLNGEEFLKIEPEAFKLLSKEAFRDISHLLRTSHLKSLQKILNDPEATKNDKFVALELLKNANIASNFVLPSCQDTGTAIVMGKKGHRVLTNGEEVKDLSEGIYETYTKTNLRYSQTAPLDMYNEVNTKTNLPGQIDLYATKGLKYEFQFMAKGGGSANKSYLYQQTKSLLNEKSLMKFLEDNIKTM